MAPNFLGISLLVTALGLAACEKPSPPPAPPQGRPGEMGLPPGTKLPRAARVPGGTDPHAHGAGDEHAAPGRALLAGSVALGPGDSVPPGAVLLLVVRDAELGPKSAPVLTHRLAAPVFPLEFELGEEHLVTKGTPVPARLLVSARLDAGGDASTRSPGELVGVTPAPVALGAYGVHLVLGPPPPG